MTLDEVKYKNIRIIYKGVNGIYYLGRTSSDIFSDNSGKLRMKVFNIDGTINNIPLTREIIPIVDPSFVDNLFLYEAMQDGLQKLNLSAHLS